MRSFFLSGLRLRPSVSWFSLCTLFGVLWIAGGASRADVMGQVVVRSAAVALLVVATLFGERPSWCEARPMMFLLAAALALALAQLIPLPPAVWQALPGRGPLAEAAAASGQAQPWRPWAIVPGAAINAAVSLIVPVTTLLLLSGMKENERRWLPGLLICFVVAAMLLGLLQASGAGIDNPLVNETVGTVSGPFGNRNHFALLMALGCVLLPAWAFLDGRRAQWRGPVAIGLTLLFLLSILASGSRAGLGLGALALLIGLFLSRRGIAREMSRYPRWATPVLIAALVAVVAVFVLISVAADRAVSIDRIFAVEAGEDMRSRGLPTVLAMIETYFPAGSGFGGFDPLFRMHEPFALLKPTYFNHAHNDFLEIVLDAGAPGLLLLLATVGWWAWASQRAWRAGSDMSRMLPKLGSVMILLVMLASAFDYPARTPIIMAVLVVAGVWLGSGASRGDARQVASPLPRDSQHL